jgi:hypothetical protein
MMQSRCQACAPIWPPPSPAIAADPAGLATDLGTTMIPANNAASILPFGTIDTPGQGEAISGTDYVNFGWVGHVGGIGSRNFFAQN